MNSTKDVNESIPLQVKVYSRWVSNQLTEGKSEIHIKDISKDLSNGVALVELAKVLTGKEPSRKWAQTPKKNVEMIQNSDLSVQMFFEDGVHLIGIAGKDIHDNNVKVIRGYIWTLIERYLIGRATYGDSGKINARKPGLPKNNKEVLMQWAIDRTSNYPNVHNFQPYSLAMCALLDSYVPDKINYYKLNSSDSKHNAQLAADVLKELGVPLYVYPEDCGSDGIDQKAVLTQLAATKIFLEKLPPAPALKVEENRIISTLSDIEPVEPPVEEVQPAPVAAPEPVPEPEPVNSDSVSDEDDTKQVVQEPVFVPGPVEGDNSQYAGRKFGLIMSLNESDYNEGKQVDLTKDELLFGEEIQLALTMEEDKHAYLNPAGLKLTIAQPNIENNVFQQFTFGNDEWSTVIDSVQQRGMVWDVADQYNTNPPAGTPFYLFMFHGRHNQHFVYKDNMIYSKQDGQVVTFVGGDKPIVMMPPSNKLRARQTFAIKLL